jgi:hypothetical protein
MYVCLEKETDKLIYSNSVCPKAFILDALKNGCKEEDLEIKEVTIEEWEALVAEANKPTLQELAKKELSITDIGMIRVIEDIIDILIINKTITEADLPQLVIDKINARKNLRSEL